MGINLYSLFKSFIKIYFKFILLKRNDLKIVVFSATMNAERLIKYFTGALLLKIHGKMYHEEIFYTPKLVTDYLKSAIKTVLQIHKVEHKEDIFFFTGEVEIEMACQ